MSLSQGNNFPLAFPSITFHEIRARNASSMKNNSHNFSPMNGLTFSTSLTILSTVPVSSLKEVFGSEAKTFSVAFSIAFGGNINYMKKH